MANKNPSPNTRFRSGKEAETNGRKGGVASGATRAELPTLREVFIQGMTPEKRVEAFERIYEMGLAGNMRAWEFIRDMIGEKPVDKIEQTVNEIAFRVEGVSQEEADEIFG